jgi:hypothetical protein
MNLWCFDAHHKTPAIEYYPQLEIGTCTVTIYDHMQCLPAPLNYSFRVSCAKLTFHFHASNNPRACNEVKKLRAISTVLENFVIILNGSFGAFEHYSQESVFFYYYRWQYIAVVSLVHIVVKLKLRGGGHVHMAML